MSKKILKWPDFDRFVESDVSKVMSKDTDCDLAECTSEMVTLNRHLESFHNESQGLYVGCVGAPAAVSPSRVMVTYP